MVGLLVMGADAVVTVRVVMASGPLGRVAVAVAAGSSTLRPVIICSGSDG